MTGYMNVKFVFILSFSLYVCVCLNVPPPPPSTYMWSDPLVKRLKIEITCVLPTILICVCMGVHIISHIDLSCRFISFDTRLNTLTVRAKQKGCDDFDFCLYVASYFLIFDYYFVVFLPSEFINVHCDIRNINKVVNFVNITHKNMVSSMSCVCIHLGYITLTCIHHFPLETLATWVCLMHLVLCPDINPNPGPVHSNNFAGGFLSFCN